MLDQNLGAPFANGLLVKVTLRQPSIPPHPQSRSCQLLAPPTENHETRQTTVAQSKQTTVVHFVRRYQVVIKPATKVDGRNQGTTRAYKISI